jgi:hypothetical protein
MWFLFYGGDNGNLKNRFLLEFYEICLWIIVFLVHKIWGNNVQQKGQNANRTHIRTH